MTLYVGAIKPEQQALLRALAELGGERSSREICERAGVDLRTGGVRLFSLWRRGLLGRRLNTIDRLYTYQLSTLGCEKAGKIEKVSGLDVTRAIEAYDEAEFENCGPRECMRRALEAVIK